MRKANAIIGLLCLLTLAPAAMAIGTDPFVGTWKVTITPDDDAARAGQKEVKDTLTFKGMKFESAWAKKHGFNASNYDQDTRGLVAATFTCKAKSKTEGTISWTGTSTSSDLRGEITWTKPNGDVLKYTYAGERASD